MRLSKLLVGLAVAAGAFAFWGANAGVAMAWQGNPDALAPGLMFPYSLSLTGGSTIPTPLAGVLCPAASVDTGSTVVCGHVPFTTIAGGTITATATIVNNGD